MDKHFSSYATDIELKYDDDVQIIPIMMGEEADDQTNHNVKEN